MDTGTILLIAGGACLLCVIVVILGFVFQVIGAFFDFIGTLVDFFFALAAGGPIPGCGCLVAAVLICGCIGSVAYIVSILPGCGTPDAVNFCRFLGY